MKKYFYIIIILIIVLALFFVSKNFLFEKVKKDSDQDYKNTTYIIDGQKIKFENGYSELEIPKSSSKIVTKYFGNDLFTDLNNDGKADVVFLVTQQTGGSGTFYYVLGAIKTENGYVGSDGFFLGDRIAPQNINNSQNPKHKNVVVVNYADRKENEPMSSQPSVGKSQYLKLDLNNMQWGIVIPDFEGESR